MAAGGKLTAQIGEHLRRSLGPQGFDVLFDHGTDSDEVGNLVVWFGPEAQPSRANELSQIDIAVREQTTGRSIALIEIEETSDRPKTLLGDIFAVLMAEHVSFKGEELRTGTWTTLIVVGVGPESHRLRNGFIAKNALLCRQGVLTEDRSIGSVQVDSVVDEASLLPRLGEHVENAIRRLPRAVP